MENNSFSRRDFLRAGTTAAAALLAACTPGVQTAAPGAVATQPPGSTKGADAAPPVKDTAAALLIFGAAGEITDQDLKGFQDAHPDVKVERQDPDGDKLKVLLAAGLPPDVIRTDGADLQNLLLRDIPLDVSDFLLASPLLKVSDFAPSCEYYHVNGKWYGIPKDWSPDFSFFGNAKMMKAADLTPPPLDRSIRYAELFEYGRKLTRKEGDKTLVAGYGYELGFFARQVMSILLEEDQVLYSEDFGKVVLKSNPLVMDVLKGFAQIAQDGITWSPLNPTQTGPAQEYINGNEALVGYGYWYSAMVNKPSSPDAKVDGTSTLFFPAPSWGGKKTVNPTIGGSGYVGAKQSKHPELTWKFLEWYLGGTPARERAASGWGVPALKSLYSLMPQTNDFQKQVQDVLQYTFQNGDANYALKFNPYYTDSVFNDSWNRNLETVLKGNAALEHAAEAMEQEVNAAIAAGKNTA